MEKELKERLEKLGFIKTHDYPYEKAWKREAMVGTVWVWENKQDIGVEAYVGSGKWIRFKNEDAIKELESIVRIFEMVI